jgi:hypothetical protein
MPNDQRELGAGAIDDTQHAIRAPDVVVRRPVGLCAVKRYRVDPLTAWLKGTTASSETREDVHTGIRNV